MRRVKARLLLLFSATGRITNWPELCPIHRKGNPRITSAASARNEWLAQIYPLWHQRGGGGAAECRAQHSPGSSGASAGTAVQPAEKAPASSAADMTDMDKHPEYLGQLAATFAPGG